MFGHSVAVSGDAAVIGAYGYDGVGNNSGSAYIFSIPTPELEQDCDTNGIPDDCEPDCNSNGITDACDIMAGTSQDCNGNSVPDECDIASGASQDCNGNSIPDECEVPTVTSAVSYKTHGSAGEFGINVLDRTGDDDFEMRKGGVTKLVVGFNQDIQGVGGLDTSDVSLLSGTVDAVSLSVSDELAIEMHGTTDGVALIVTFPGIVNVSCVNRLCTDSVCIRQLVGNVRTDSAIAAADRIDVRNQMGQPVTSSNFRADVRADGRINAGDRIDVRNAIGNGYTSYTSETCP